MKLVVSMSLTLFGMLLAMSQKENNTITGLWLNHLGTSVIEIYEEEDKFYGKIYEILKFPEDQKEQYTEEQLAVGKEKMKGRLVLTDLQFKEDYWTNGKIKDPKDNTTIANCSIRLGPDNSSLQLKVKKGFFSSTKTWSRYTIN